jgi:hypothetical protein
MEHSGVFCTHPVHHILGALVWIRTGTKNCQASGGPAVPYFSIYSLLNELQDRFFPLRRALLPLPSSSTGLSAVAGNPVYPENRGACGPKPHAAILQMLGYRRDLVLGSPLPRSAGLPRGMEGRREEGRGVSQAFGAALRTSYAHEALKIVFRSRFSTGDQVFRAGFHRQAGGTWYKEYRQITYLEGHLCDLNLP